MKQPGQVLYRVGPVLNECSSIDLYNPDRIDEIVLTNSSVIGPLFGLSKVFDEMADRPCDGDGCRQGGKRRLGSTGPANSVWVVVIGALSHDEAWFLSR